MKKNLTELVFILDRSGSMYDLAQDTIGGFNSMIDKQRALPGEALVSTVLFNTNTTVVHDRVPLTDVRPMTAADYAPGGCTALLDALGSAIHHIGNVHKYARKEDVPERTLFIITTDGMENASHRYTLAEIRQMIQRQQDKYGWEFLFLAANIDAIAAAGSMGISPDRAVNYVPDAAGQAVYREELCAAMAEVRANRPIPARWNARTTADHKRRG
ncbi:MAG: VWA domain-containing protein [Clostridia bacterium]|nr:VWA domain-containing protein [Clostridia bacterium]